MFNQDLCQRATLVGGALVCPEEQAERNEKGGQMCALPFGWREGGAERLSA